MERLRVHNPEVEKSPGRQAVVARLRLLLASAALLGLISATACASQKPESPDDGYMGRQVLHSVTDPLNGDKYISLTFSDRETQERSEVNFHHLKSNPEEYERLVASIAGENKTILTMQQENVPIGNIEFQHSTITFQDTKNGNIDTLQINRVKPITKEAPQFTAYSLFVGKDNPSSLGTLIFSDEQNQKHGFSGTPGKRGEVFVALKPGTFAFAETSERFANSYSQKVADLMDELRQKQYKDSRVDQAVWKTSGNNRMTIMQGVLQGVSYTIVSRFGQDKSPGYHLNDGGFASAEIFTADKKVVASINVGHFRGMAGSAIVVAPDSVVYTFKDGEGKTVLEVKRYFADKSETLTSHGVGTTVGLSSSGNIVVGWTSINLQTPVNYQDEHTMLSAYGRRDQNPTAEEIKENMKSASAIFTLLGGASILNGLNFQDGEQEWGQDMRRLVGDAKTGSLKSDMGFWFNLPVDSTPTGQEEALRLLTGN